jgi:hypothetical protein
MQGALGIVLALLMSGPQQQQQPPSVPDAPVPNAPIPQGLSDLKDVTPGKAPAPDTANPDQSQPAPQAAQPTAAPTEDQPQEEAPEIGAKGSNAYILPPAGVNIVVVPVTVRDSKGKSVPGLTYRDFRVYENKERQRITFSAPTRYRFRLPS